MMIVVYGPDSFRALGKIKEMKEKFVREIDELDTSFGEIEAKALTVADLSRVLATDSLFAKKRLILIRNLMASKAESVVGALADYLSSIKTDNIVIFYEEQIGLDKNKKPVSLGATDKPKALNKAQQKLWSVIARDHQMYYPLLSDQELVRWWERRLAELGVTMSRVAQQRLLAAIGPDLWLLNNELEKLAAYKLASGGGEIDEEDLRLLVSHDLNQSIFELTDAIGNRDKAKAITLMRQQLIQNVMPLYLLAMLTRQFKIILSVRQALDNGQNVKLMTETLKLHPYVLQKSINQARNYNLVTLKSIMATLTKIDYNFKTGKWGVEMMLEILIARL